MAQDRLGRRNEEDVRRPCHQRPQRRIYSRTGRQAVRAAAARRDGGRKAADKRDRPLSPPHPPGFPHAACDDAAWRVYAEGDLCSVLLPDESSECLGLVLRTSAGKTIPLALGGNLRKQHYHAALR